MAPPESLDIEHLPRARHYPLDTPLPFGHYEHHRLLARDVFVNHIMSKLVVGVLLVFGVLSQLRLQLAHFMFELDDIVAVYLLVRRGIEVFADRARSFARQASRERRVTPCFTL